MPSIITASTASNTALNLSADTSGVLEIRTGSSPTTAMTIDGSQNVGIGTASPASFGRLAVSGNVLTCVDNSFIGLNDGTQNTLSLVKKSGGFPCIAAGSSAPIIFANSSAASISSPSSETYTERMRITSAGNVGIGTSSPSAKLDVRYTSFTPSSSIGSLLVEESTAWSQSIQFYINNAGTFASSRPSGALGAANSYSLYLTGGSIITNDPDGGNGYTATSTAASAYRVGSGIHYWFTNTSLTAGNTFTATERMRITANGRLLVGTTSENTSGGVLQVSNGITFPATQSASSDANTLDDYEEGTWTPTIGGTSSNPTATANGTNAGFYVKVGRAVHIRANITFSSINGGSGDAVIGGLPFASTEYWTSVSMGYRSGSSGDQPQACMVENGTTRMKFWTYTSTTNPRTGVDQTLTVANYSTSIDWYIEGTYFTS